MFSDISVQRWEQFFETVSRIMQCDDGSEAERMKDIWDKAERAGCYIEFTELVYGLEQVRNSDEDTDHVS